MTSNDLKEFGTVSFAWHDIEFLKPKWSKEKIEKFLEENENELYEVMLDAGSNCINKLLKGMK